MECRNIQPECQHSITGNSGINFTPQRRDSYGKVCFITHTNWFSLKRLACKSQISIGPVTDCTVRCSEESRKKLTGPLTNFTLQKLLHGDHQWPVKERPFLARFKIDINIFRCYYYYYYYHHHHHHHIILVITLMQGIDPSIRKRNKSCFQVMHCCSCFVFTICSTCNVISHVKYVFYFYNSNFRSMFAVLNIAVFVVSLVCVFLACCSGIV